MVHSSLKIKEDYTVYIESMATYVICYNKKGACVYET